MSPRTDAEEGELSADALSASYSDLAPTERISKTTWTSLGTLPSSTVSPSRSSSLPEPGRATATQLDLSNEHRSSSTMIVSSPTEQRRYSTPSAYSSIIQDLVISPFAKQSASPLRSATLPRSRSRSSHAASKPSSVSGHHRHHHGHRRAPHAQVRQRALPDAVFPRRPSPTLTLAGTSRRKAHRFAPLGPLVRKPLLDRSSTTLLRRSASNNSPPSRSLLYLYPLHPRCTRIAVRPNPHLCFPSLSQTRLLAVSLV